MKIRTDFVTNSSSSSFTVEIDFLLKDGKHISWSEVGSDDGANMGEIIASVSPKQLGKAKTVDNMIDLLKTKVYGCNSFDGSKLYFFDENNDETKAILDGIKVSKATDAESEFAVFQKTAYEEANGFIKSLKALSSMDDIFSITISGDEENGFYNKSKTFVYNRETGDYTVCYEGDEEELIHDGVTGGALKFRDEENAENISDDFDEDFDDEDYDDDDE